MKILPKGGIAVEFDTDRHEEGSRGRKHGLAEGTGSAAILPHPVQSHPFVIGIIFLRK